MKTCIFYLLFAFGVVSGVCAQNIRISGRVVDVKGARIAFANLTLQRTDSTFVNGCTSDDKGGFMMKGLSADNYLLQVSFVGYVTQVIRLDNLNSSLDIGDILLEEDAVLLQGVTVTASNVVKKPDRQIILPSKKQVKASSSGYELLTHMQLPGLKVNALQRSVSTLSGGSVQLRINDIEATEAQVQALRPEEVLRVEYIDNPGVRYADSGAEAVINYVVKRAQSGISGGVGLTNAVTTGFGNDQVYLRANHKLSEFGLSYYVSYRDYDDRFVDEDQTFATSDQDRRQRVLEGISTPFSYVQHEIEATYNLTKQDNYVFNALFSNSIFDSPHADFGQRIHETGKEDIYNYTRAINKSSAPALDLYYKKTLPKNQELMLNVVGTYIGSDYERGYREYTQTMDDPLSVHDYSTDGARYSLIGEGAYKKSFEKVSLSAGLKYMQAYTRNRYTGSVEETAEMHNSNFYAYTQVQGKWAKLNYNVGVGVSRETFDESGEGFTFYTFRPIVQLSYPMFKGASLRYTFNSYPSLPSLSALSDIRQQVTDIEVNRGNRGLDPYRSYNNRLQLSWGNKVLSTQLTGAYLYSRKPIMQQIGRTDFEDGSYEFEYATANQKSFSRLTGQLYVEAKLIPDILSVSAYAGVNRYESRGHTYSHGYTAWYVGGDVSMNYKNFSFYGNIGNRYESLFGETVNYGEKSCVLQCSYTLKAFRIGAGILYPFMSEGWSAGSKLLNNLVKKEQWTYIKNNANMFMVSCSWNFNSGRRHEAEKKKMSNADRETGIVQ